MFLHDSSLICLHWLGLGTPKITRTTGIWLWTYHCTSSAPEITENVIFIFTFIFPYRVTKVTVDSSPHLYIAENAVSNLPLHWLQQKNVCKISTHTGHSMILFSKLIPQILKLFAYLIVGIRSNKPARKQTDILKRNIICWQAKCWVPCVTSLFCETSYTNIRNPKLTFCSFFRFHGSIYKCISDKDVSSTFCIQRYSETKTKGTTTWTFYILFISNKSWEENMF